LWPNSRYVPDCCLKELKKKGSKSWSLNLTWRHAVPVAKRRNSDSKDRSASTVGAKSRGRVELGEIAGFRRGAVESFVLLECYTVLVGSWLPIFKGHTVQGSNFTLGSVANKPCRNGVTKDQQTAQNSEGFKSLTSWTWSWRNYDPSKDCSILTRHYDPSTDWLSLTKGIRSFDDCLILTTKHHDPSTSRQLFNQHNVTSQKTVDSTANFPHKTSICLPAVSENISITELSVTESQKLCSAGPRPSVGTRRSRVHEHTTGKVASASLQKWLYRDLYWISE